MKKKNKMIEQLMNEYGYRESGTDDLIMSHVLTDSNSVGYGGGVESLTEGSWPFDQPSESNGPTPMATIDLQSYYGGSSDTGFELLDVIEGQEPSGQIHFPYYSVYKSGLYKLMYYGILHNGYNLPNFTKLSVDNTEYDIYPIPEQEPSTAGCYLGHLYQEPIDSQEIVDEIKAELGIDVKIGDTLVAIYFALVTEQVVLSGDVPFTLYAGQDSWSGTLHEYIETNAEVYAIIEPNSNSTAYALSVYPDNASNPQYKINDNGEWTPYNADNKSEFYLPGNYTIYLKAESNYDGSEVSNSLPMQIIANFDVPEVHIVEDPSAMFAGLDFRVHLTSNYSSSELTGRDDVVLLYKEQSAADWSSAAMTGTSNGYFAEVETGWGHHTIEYKVQVDGVSSDTASSYVFDALPMTPSFVDFVNNNGTYYARLRFGANYPGMNTVETIEAQLIRGNANGDETWIDTVYDTVSGYALLELPYTLVEVVGDISSRLPTNIHFRTKINSTPQIVSSVQYASIPTALAVIRNAQNYNFIAINGRNGRGIVDGQYVNYGVEILYANIPFLVDISPSAGFSRIESSVYKYDNRDGSETLYTTFTGDHFECIADSTINNIDYIIDVVIEPTTT